MRFDFADLQLFLCIAETGSISQGAIKSHLALSSASQRLKHMEEDAGVALLKRHARGIYLTEAGEVLFQHAKIMLQQHKILKTELNRFRLGQTGTLHLDAPTSALTSFLPAKLAPWLGQNPNIKLELSEHNSREIIQRILTGQVDAGLISDTFEHADLNIEPIKDDHLTLIIPKDHLLSGKDQVQLSDMYDQNFVGLSAENALQQHVEDQAKILGKQLNFRIRMKTFEGMCEMVDQGIGVGILPEVIANQHQAKFSYKKLTLQEKWAQRKLCICYRQWDELSPAMRHLLSYLKTKE